MGLAHSATQGEADGAFRWSRGHYLTNRDGEGTIMTYGSSQQMAGFSSPARTCLGSPCGVPVDRPFGAHAVRSLDLLRFQIADHRPSQSDRDGDGFADPGDAAPDDRTEWIDTDGDGQGDNADGDDDNDGVADTDDPFPLDPMEWEDADGDGIGDNADTEVADLTPFRDPALRAAVARALGKSPDAVLGSEDLATLTTLTANREGIRSLSGLENATKLAELSLRSNTISDLSPLAGLAELRRLYLDGNDIADLSPLAGLNALQTLVLDINEVEDIAPLAALRSLEVLRLSWNLVSDLAPLAGLTDLRTLRLDVNAVSDLAPLEGLSNLRTFSLNHNAVADLSPLAGLTGLLDLRLAENAVTDLGPLAGLARLRVLDLAINTVTDLRPRGQHGRTSISQRAPQRRIRLVCPSQLAPNRSRYRLQRRSLGGRVGVAGLPELEGLDVSGLGIETIDGLSEMQRPDWLRLDDNSISDLSPLATLTGLRHVNLERNKVTDIGPLVRRSVWWLDDAGAPSGSLYLAGNPLNRAARFTHIPQLRGWGVEVYAPSRDTVSIPDPRLRAIIAQTLANYFRHLDAPITHSTMGDLVVLRAFGAGVVDLTGLERARNLTFAHLGSNSVIDLKPLAGLGELSGVDLSDNDVADLSPLVENPHFGAGAWLTVSRNPLSEEALNTQIPALIARGVEVRLDAVRLQAAPDQQEVTFDTAGYFEAILGAGFELTGASSSSDLASAEVSGNTVKIQRAGESGASAVTVTARGVDGTTTTLSFNVGFGTRHQRTFTVPLLPAPEPSRQGFARIINQSTRPGNITIEATDDSGMRAPTVTLAIDAGHAVHLSSTDLEQGNRGKGLSGGIGPGTGDWRLSVHGDLDLDVLSYIRTSDGFVTSMHDRAPALENGAYAVPFFNPASNTNQVSRLRLVNRSDDDATVDISGTDDLGRSSTGTARLTVPARGAVTVSALDLESGTGLDGALGNGAGRWRLTVTSSRPIIVMNLVESPTGHLANLSATPRAPRTDGVHTVPLFPSASDAHGRQGFVRVINRSDVAGRVRIKAHDETTFVYESVTLTIGAGEARQFNSDDLELGNVSKGLSGSTGAGQGHWRLDLTSDLEIDVLSFVRTSGGFVTSMHDVARLQHGAYEIPFFNPGSNTQQVSTLRLINPDIEDATVSLVGVDDVGLTRYGIRIHLAAGGTLDLSAAELEQGGAGFFGSLGTGEGNWRLRAHPQPFRPLIAMSVLASTTGPLANLSTMPGWARCGRLR